MTVEKLISVLGAQPLTSTPYDGVEIEGCYVCDLLSLAMSKVQAKDVWITVQANVNIAAVAVLTEASCVLVAENMAVEDSVIKKAESQDVIILRTEKSAYEAAIEIGKML